MRDCTSLQLLYSGQSVYDYTTVTVFNRRIRPIHLFIAGVIEMIAYIEVPPIVNELDEASRKLYAEISQQLCNFGTSVKVDTGEDISGKIDTGWAYVQNGVFKYFFGNKLVRLYSTGDIIAVAPSSGGNDCRCVSEFGSKIRFLTHDDAVHFISEHQDVSGHFLEMITLQSQLMHILCACYTTEDIRPDITIKKFEPGTTIIAEGDPAKEIYQMIQGKAAVTVNGVRVGNVEEGEVFGEISFLTESTRSATVTAETECLVQIMGKNDFTTMIKLKPSVNLAISKTLSQRLMETNKKISEQH
jgi:CRP/FNR family transcriptional regulator, cyclic AMP receptor protein